MRNWNVSCSPPRMVSRRCFQTTYEELKLSHSTAFGFCFIKLPDYLWGIETAVGVAWDYNAESRFQTTYEELKLISFTSAIAAAASASRLPMRNWNDISFPSSMYLSNARFQTTYEELKLLWRFLKKRDTRPRFQTTYEELKPSSSPYFVPPVIALPDYLWGIETRAGSDDSEDQLPASRLPMRNWNEKPSTVFNWLMDKLPDYLWGIETCSAFDNSSNSMRRLPDYLWGIETRTIRRI